MVVVAALLLMWCRGNSLFDVPCITFIIVKSCVSKSIYTFALAVYCIINARINLPFFLLVFLKVVFCTHPDPVDIMIKLYKTRRKTF